MAEQPPKASGAPGGDPRRMEVRRSVAELGARTYAIQLLSDAGIPFLVGGAYAFAHYTGIYRDTKDLDLFLHRKDGDRALELLARNEWRTESEVHGWLHKAFWADFLVDLIYGSGNGITAIDEAWFEHAVPAQVLGCPCRVPPAEEIFWSKAFVLERERFDGHELTHLLLKTGATFDWERLLRRFDRYWEVLLSHLLFFRFAYPSDRAIVPDWLMRELLSRADSSVDHGNWQERICRGRLLSPTSYRVDVDEWGYEDGDSWDKRERKRDDPSLAAGGAPGAHGPH
ncbi:nucleotidyltransferase family protein [Myxococcus sp. CA051A]|uniref:Nucleotidyltransferase family protein n=2 Tax=Myxococcaceae TaxID=31 RepID=A0A540X0C5_9BACT|nr:MULTISPECIES: nucleotidyltransferase family protein [unclassified Myxococcus]NTX06375.1 nucleotidyltransferase family protein [Myxococcus sp. CA040A]NTX58137.1 nucleotidyltransferase family protein [Myxococcus sp. CA039A]NTX64971.1 nucleotidyltransferase family protein [Myxococcus sp. CA051A]TQF14711.1 nucleotidyltransferase family protein [Myxococcus llanfairpwllgwyngyllgogerychwyrndrobwllllantysiliogogogochensis]NTX09633.1 nucleotidyltransferase family protein [Myxococcus sp. CA056]